MQIKVYASRERGWIAFVVNGHFTFGIFPAIWQWSCNLGFTARSAWINLGPFCFSLYRDKVDTF